jgi:hypothetical protein
MLQWLQMYAMTTAKTTNVCRLVSCMLQWTTLHLPCTFCLAGSSGAHGWSPWTQMFQSWTFRYIQMGIR